MIDDKIGEDIFHIKTRSSAKASGEQVGEVHGANKPLDPSYKPEHQSKSKLPSVIGKQSPVKTPRKSILRTPVKQTKTHKDQKLTKWREHLYCLHLYSLLFLNSNP